MLDTRDLWDELKPIVAGGTQLTTTCPHCKQGKSDVEVRVGQLSCLECARQRASRAAFTYSNLVSDEVIQVPYGWATATCVDGMAVEWLCKHIHKTEEDAETCLAGRVGRGVAAATNLDEENLNS